MSEIGNARRALVARIVEGEGVASREQRRAAFDGAGLAGPVGALVEKVCQRAREVTDEDVAALGASNVGEDEAFEIVVCAAVGEATRQLESALAALRAARGED
jgi:hypothetical protein